MLLIPIHKRGPIRSQQFAVLISKNETKNIWIWPWFHWTFPQDSPPPKKEGQCFKVFFFVRRRFAWTIDQFPCLVHGFVGKTASRCSSIFSAPRHLKVLKWRPYNIDWKKRQQIKRRKHKCKKWMWKAAMLRLRHEGWFSFSCLKRCVLEGNCLCLFQTLFILIYSRH